VRRLVLLLLAACAKEPAKQPPPPPPPPPPAVAPAATPSVPACSELELRQCSTDVQTADGDPGLTLALTNTATQGTDPGETFTEPYWDCDVLVSAPGKVVRATHHRDDLHVALEPGAYVVRLDGCFGCRADVPIAITRGHAVTLRATCHDQGK